MKQFLKKPLSFFRIIFLDFKLDENERQKILHLSSYASVVISDSGVAFLEESDDVMKFFAFHNSGGISSRPADFIYFQFCVKFFMDKLL